MPEKNDKSKFGKTEFNAVEQTPVNINAQGFPNPTSSQGQGLDAKSNVAGTEYDARGNPIPLTPQGDPADVRVTPTVSGSVEDVAWKQVANAQDYLGFDQTLRLWLMDNREAVRAIVWGDGSGYADAPLSAQTVEPGVNNFPYVSQTVSFEYRGKTRAAIVVAVHGAGDTARADLQVIMPVQGDRDNSPLELVQNVRISDFDF